MNTSKIKKVLVGLLVLGALSAAIGSGTFASFNATTGNSAQITTGTLILGNSVNGSSPDCLSATSTTITAANANTGCNAYFPLANRYGGKAATLGVQDLKLTNDGTVNAATLKVYGDALCADNNTTDTINGSVYHGSGSLCGKYELVVAETNSTYTTVSACVYGDTTVANPLGAGSNCGFNTADTFTAFSTTYTSSAQLSTGSGLNAGVSRYFIVAVASPDLDNTYQGRVAAVTIDWQIAE